MFGGGMVLPWDLTSSGRAIPVPFAWKEIITQNMRLCWACSLKDTLCAGECQVTAPVFVILLPNYLHEAEPSLRSCQFCSYSGTSWHFMEPGGLLLCSEEVSTGPYTEPYQSSPQHPIHINVINPFFLDLPSGPDPSRFPTNILRAFLFSICVTCPAHLILLTS
jgi:hypothetical protein